MTDELAEWRSDIDDYDRQIVDLVGKRQATSKLIQEWRRSHGGGPIDPTREAKVLAGYETPLGAAGRDLATAVLDCCRPSPGARGQA